MILGLVLYAVLMIMVGYLYSRRGGTGKDNYIVANRTQGWVRGGLSIAATWIWAPALFVSSQNAYEKGLIGFFWFFVPNVLTIIVFGYIAVRHLSVNSNGYTFPGYMKKRYGEKVHKLYLLQFSILQVMSIGVQLLAGGGVISLVTGIDYTIVIGYLLIVTLIYSSMGGIKASIMTDAIQMLFMLGAGLVAVTIIISEVGILPMVKGLSGISGDGGVLFGRDFFMAMLVYGITSTIGLFAGPAGDQMFWQRVYSIKKEHTGKAFAFGAIIFAMVPLIFGFLGFSAAGLRFIPSSSQMVNIEIINHYSTGFVSIMVTMLIISGLGSTMDSAFCAVSSLAEEDFKSILFAKSSIKKRYGSMILVGILGFFIALIPGIEIFHLWLFYGTLRASTMLPTFITVLTKKEIKSKYIERGLLGSFGIGIPVYIYGSVAGDWRVSLLGALLTCGISGAFALKGVVNESRNN